MARNNGTQPNRTELARLKYGHVENIIALAIVAVIALGGFVCLIYGQPCGQTIIVAVLSFVGGWAAKRGIHTSGRM